MGKLGLLGNEETSKKEASRPLSLWPARMIKVFPETKHLNPEDGDSMFFWNAIMRLQDYTMPT
jgi:hypothetical protein